MSPKQPCNRAARERQRLPPGGWRSQPRERRSTLQQLAAGGVPPQPLRSVPHLDLRREVRDEGVDKRAFGLKASDPPRVSSYVLKK